MIVKSSFFNFLQNVEFQFKDCFVGNEWDNEQVLYSIKHIPKHVVTINIKRILKHMYESKFFFNVCSNPSKMMSLWWFTTSMNFQNIFQFRENNVEEEKWTQKNNNIYFLLLHPFSNKSNNNFFFKKCLDLHLFVMKKYEDNLMKGKCLSRKYLFFSVHKNIITK